MHVRKCVFFLIFLTIAFMRPVMKNVMHKSAPGLRIKSSRYCFVPIGKLPLSLSISPSLRQSIPPPPPLPLVFSSCVYVRVCVCVCSFS